MIDNTAQDGTRSGAILLIYLSYSAQFEVSSLVSIYNNWALLNGFKATQLDSAEQGITVLQIEGEGVYQQIKGETGVHRFTYLLDSGKRLTVFIGVSVIPLTDHWQIEDGALLWHDYVRAYQFHPDRKVRCLRTGLIVDLDAVLGGDLSAFQ